MAKVAMNDISIPVVVIAVLSVLFGLGKVGSKLSPDSLELKDIKESSAYAINLGLILGVVVIVVIVILTLAPIPGG